MSIPLDRLYHHLESLCSDNIIIYHWYPHGSKNLHDLKPIKNFLPVEFLTLPTMIAHDQEPLDYDFLESQILDIQTPKLREYPLFVKFLLSLPKIKMQTNALNVYKKSLLCHSEKNSADLKKFDDYFVGVYHWSHAMIARDWFRFAEQDLSIANSPLGYTHDFLIYNRAWNGSREYRLKFTELLIENNLVDCSLVKFSPFDTEKHYTQHNFKNTEFKILNFSMETEIPENTAPSCYSADYAADDYNACGIEIVLETLFDDSRNHLTEKVLRAIACGKPFILASTPGSLQYLRDYGFKTFDCLINESYDLVQDPLQRLEAIIDEMSRIKKLSKTDKLELFTKLNSIAEYNKKLFFSSAWQKTIEDEFVFNFKKGRAELEKSKNGRVWKITRELVDQDTMQEVFSKDIVTALDTLIDQLNTDPSQ
jgi:glycosyltransferase involved in cell wall biosynthesis